MPTSSTTLRRPRPTSAPLFKHSYITFIGHWKGQLCILVVVLIVGLIYFVIREPIQKWRRRRRERLSAWAREGLLAAEKKGKEREKEREKEKERSRVGDRDRNPASAQLHLGSDGEKTVLGQEGASGAGAGTGNASRAGSQGQGQAASTGSTSALATPTSENRKSRRRKSSVLKVDTGLLSASQGSAGMSKTGSGISTASLTSGASGASGVSSRSGTPSLALTSVSEVDTAECAVPARQDNSAVQGEAGRKDDEVGEGDAEGGKRSSAQDKGKGRAVPLVHPSSASASTRSAPANEIARPSPIHIHVRQPTVVVDSAEVQNFRRAGAHDDAGFDDAAGAGEGSGEEPSQGKGRKHAESVDSSVAMSLSDSGSHDASFSDREHGDCNASTSHITGCASETVPETKEEKDIGKKRDEGFSIFPDEGWLPPSALAALAAGEKKKKKKGKGTGTAVSVTAANIAHANGLVKNGESSRMATGTSSSGSVSGRSVTSAGTGAGAGSGTGLGESPASRSSILPPLPSFGSPTSIPNPGSASQSGAEVDASTNTKTNATSTPPLMPITSNPTSVSSSAHQHRSRPTGNPFGHAGHSRKASMGKISGISSLEEQIRERDEIIDNLRAEVGRAKAEEMKARGELEMRVSSEDQGMLGLGKGEERSSGRRSSVQKQLAEALAGMSSQASRIEMLEQLIASSGLSVPSADSTSHHADHHVAQTAQPQSNGSHRRQSHHQHQQPRLNRIASMPNGSAHQQPNGHVHQHPGALAVPVSPMHPQMTGQQQQQHPGQSPMMRHMGGMTPLQHPQQPNSPFMPSPNPSIGMGMQSPHMPYAYSPLVQAQMQAYNAQLQMQGQGQGQAMMHPLAHQQQMAQMQIQMMHGHQVQIQQVQHQHPHSAQPYTPQRHSFHYANGTMNGNGAAPTSPSPYRRMSTATSASASTGRNGDREHGRLRDGSKNSNSNEASQGDRERERDEILGVADHPLAGPLTPGHHHHHHAHVSPSPARYAPSANGSDGQGTQGIFGAMQADRDRTNGEVHEANGFEHVDMVGGYGGLGFPSMQAGMDVGALGYADTGIGRPPGEERAAEGQRRASVESSVLKRKPIEPLTIASASASASATGVNCSADGDALILEEDGEGGADSGKTAAEGAVQEDALSKGEDKGADAERRPGDHEEPASDALESNTTNGKQDQESSNTSSAPSSGPTSPRSRQVLVTPGSTILEVHDHDNPQGAERSSNGIKEEDEQQHDHVDLVSPSPSPLPRAHSSNQSRMSVHVPSQNLSPMLYPIAMANGQAHVNGYHHHHHHPSPSPSPHLAHFSHAHMGQPSPVLPLSIPLPVSPVPMGGGMYPFPQAPHAQLNGYAAGGQGAKHSSSHYENHTGQGLEQGHAEHAPASSTPLKLKLPDYTPTFASVAHTPEQLMEIKRMNEEAVRRAVEESRA